MAHAPPKTIFCANRGLPGSHGEFWLLRIPGPRTWSFLRSGPGKPKMKRYKSKTAWPKREPGLLGVYAVYQAEGLLCVFPLFPYGAPNFLANTKHIREYNNHKEGRMPLALALGRVPISNLCTSTLGTGWCGCFQEQLLHFTKSWDKSFSFSIPVSFPHSGSCSLWNHSFLLFPAFMGLFS